MMMGIVLLEGVLMIGITYVCWNGLNVFCIQSSWFMTSIVVEFGLV